MKLTSMTSFVLEQKQSESLNENTFINTELISLEKIRNYAKFLKQPLKIEMFVPCVDDEPIEFHEGKVLRIAKVGSEVLKEAKEKVLFEGFELVRFMEKENPCYVVSNGENEVTFHIGLYNFSKGVNFAKTIEDLIHIQPILTESTIKQIGL